MRAAQILLMRETANEVVKAYKISQIHELGTSLRHTKRFGYWYRFHDFFNRPWFSRIWLIQEVIVAAGDRDVVC